MGPKGGTQLDELFYVYAPDFGNLEVSRRPEFYPALQDLSQLLAGFPLGISVCPHALKPWYLGIPGAIFEAIVRRLFHSHFYVLAHHNAILRRPRSARPRSLKSW